MKLFGLSVCAVLVIRSRNQSLGSRSLMERSVREKG